MTQACNHVNQLNLTPYGLPKATAKEVKRELTPFELEQLKRLLKYMNVKIATGI